MTNRRPGNLAADRSSSAPLSLSFAIPPSKQGVAKHRPIHLIQRARPDGHDAGTILASIQRLGAHDQPGTTRFTHGVDGREPGDQNNEPSLTSGGLQDARRDGRLAEALVGQPPKRRLGEGRRATGLPSGVSLLTPDYTHQPALAASGSSI